jgi:hypothetical protein
MSPTKKTKPKVKRPTITALRVEAEAQRLRADANMNAYQEAAKEVEDRQKMLDNCATEIMAHRTLITKQAQRYEEARQEIERLVRILQKYGINPAVAA